MGKKNRNMTGLSRIVREAFSSNIKQSSLGEASLAMVAATEVVSTTLTEVSSSVNHSVTVEDTASEARPPKKRRTGNAGLLGSGLEKYDATGLAPFYTELPQVPDHLRKYFAQRERYFSRYSEGCLLDEEGWYSVTPEAIADQIAERCRCSVVLDAFCGVGGNAIAFAKTCERVIALDTSPVRLALARHNAALYGVADRIEFILADFFDFSRTIIKQSQQREAQSAASGPHRKIDVVFLSPPWGGPSYLSEGLTTSLGSANPDIPTEPPEYSLSNIQPVHGTELFKLTRQITKNVAYFLPRNVKLEEVSSLLLNEGGDVGEPEMVEIEEEWMGNKLKALTCYFGGLVAGQEQLFDN